MNYRVTLPVTAEMADYDSVESAAVRGVQKALGRIPGAAVQASATERSIVLTIKAQGAAASGQVRELLASLGADFEEIRP